MKSGDELGKKEEGLDIEDKCIWERRGKIKTERKLTEGKRYKPLREYYKTIKGLKDKTDCVIRVRAKNLSGFGEF